MANLTTLQRQNDQRWATAKLTKRLNFNPVAQKAFKNRDRYLDIVHRLQALGSNIPDNAWVFIAVIHNRESGMDFTTHLGQGDPLNRKTVHVPAGRGPFTGPDAFERGAVDALWYCAPYAAKVNKDWSISGQLTYLEAYNGLKYANVNRPSPYLWSGTTIYDPPTGPGGKVTVDHGPIVNSVVDKQLGVAGLLKAVDVLDDSIDFSAIPMIEGPSVVPEHEPTPNLFDAVWLQDALNRLGTTPQLKTDGIIGTATKTAVKAFQRSHKLKVDGIVGKDTLPLIKAELKKAKLPLFPEKADA